ncbi:MAG: hypothetical protein ACOX8G_02465 [Eubacterium sp.]|jgi:hypothetical protein|uniref:hypothetical protein n=1 Tax=Clostridium sp. (strain SY8519) TaxID=1042156 RepID=UPI0002172142|nr:hypothetical protein [Clostridium sp. SY8519]BAK46828.1 hypothetical protein CXIVA_08610 [Clostridium sp. SY8519]
MNTNKKELVFAELQYYDRQGIGIFLDGKPADFLAVCDAIHVHEDDSFMRDYIFNNRGSLKAIRINRIAGDCL